MTHSPAEINLAKASESVRRKPGQRAGARRMFQAFAHKTSAAVGSPWAFLLAAAVVMTWGLLGPVFRFSDTWQLVINTSTTIITFLMVFLIQNTQNRDAKALHLKLDELIRSIEGARNTLVDLEDCTDEELRKIEQEFRRLRQSAERKEEAEGAREDQDRIGT